MKKTVRASSQKKVEQAGWQRVALLCVLGYEAAGSLLGGSLLIAAPDGRYMDMPVNIMRGVLPDFLVPGMILFILGIINSVAFFNVLRRNRIAWIMSGLALGGLFIWFCVEIAILQELHWLHLMWGFPVFLGYIVAVPLFCLNHAIEATRKKLLFCGILSSIWYVLVNRYVPTQYEGYSMASFTVSELSAIGSPTRILWVLLVIPYPLLFTAFGWGVWQSAAGKRSLRVAAGLIIIYCIQNFYWPPMHRREIIAAGGASLTDTLHIAWAMLTLVFMMLIMGFGAAAFGKRFRLYTIATWIIFLIFGILTWTESPGIEANLPTPRIGVWERINIGAFLLWIIVFSFYLMRKGKLKEEHA